MRSKGIGLILKNKTLKGTILKTSLQVVGVLCVFASCCHASATRMYEGNAIDDGLQVEFALGARDVALVRVSQKSADYKLKLSNGQNGELVKYVNFPGYLGLDELILVEPNECSVCLLTVSGQDDLDKNSPFRVEVEISLRTSYNKDFIAGFRHFNKAGELAYQTKKSGDNQELLELISNELDSSATFFSEEDSLDYRVHVMSLKANFLFKDEKPDQAKAVFEEVSQNQGAHEFYVQSLYELGAFEENSHNALKRYEEATDIAIGLNDHFLIAKGYNYQATALIRNAAYQRAFELLDKSHSLALGIKNWRVVLDVLHNLSWGNTRYGNYPAAIKFATEQKLLAEQLSDHENALWGLYNLAISYRAQGNLHIADEFLELAIIEWDESEQVGNKPSKSLKAYIQLERAQGFLDIGASDLAADGFLSAIASFESLGWENRVQEIKTMLIDALVLQGKHAEADELYRARINYSIENSPDFDIATTWLKYAQSKLVNRQYIDAAEHQLQAFNIIKSIGDKKLIARSLNQAIEIQHQLGRYKSARDIVNLAEPFVAEYSSSIEKARYNYRRAQVSYALGENDKALQEVEESRKILESQFDQISHRRLKRSLLGLFKDVYSLNLTLLQNKDTENTKAGIRLVEQYRSLNLYPKFANDFVEVDPQLFAERSRLLADVQNVAVKSYETGIEGSGSYLADARSISYALEKVEIEISEQKSHSRAAPNLKIDAASFSAASGELVAYYFLGKNESALWTISEQGIHHHRLPSESELQPLVEEFVGLLSISPAERTGVSAWKLKQVSQEISKIIIEPLEKALIDSSAKRLSIVADGILSSVPFGALSINGGRQLINEIYPITYAKSLVSRQRELGSLAKIEDANLLVVANPLNSSYLGESLDPLPYSKVEATEISNTFRGQVTLLEGVRATRRNFIDRIQPSRSIVHIATHGLVNQIEPDLSGLVFASGIDQRSLLLLPEIRSLQINAELVVLSACESGQGKRVTGEGLLSLSNAFLGAGAKQVLGSLWKVHDHSTAYMMTEFYRSLLYDRVSTAQAIQRAANKVRKNEENDWSDPYYWAGFQLMGRQ